MTNDILSGSPRRSLAEWALLGLTLLLSGRAMTLFFLADVGGPNPSDPPAAWLMPLVGDAVVGVSALLVLALIWFRAGRIAWLLLIVWNAVAIWDALSAFLVNLSTPWPSFFMLQLIGWPMFFVAALMHVACIVIAARPATRELFLHRT